jgi:hypothetical protein
MTTEFDPLALFTKHADAAVGQEEPEQFEFGVDQARVERDAKRRERLGQLRARAHPTKRANHGVEQFYK